MENPLDVLGVPRWLVAQESKRGTDGLKFLQRTAKMLYHTLSQLTHPDGAFGNRESFERITTNWEMIKDLELLEFWVENLLDSGKIGANTVQQLNQQHEQITQESITVLRRLLANTSSAQVAGVQSVTELVFGFDRFNAYGEATVNGERSFFVKVDGDKACEVFEQAHPSPVEDAPLEIYTYRKDRNGVWRGLYMSADKANNPKSREFRFTDRISRAPVRLVGAIPSSRMKALPGSRSPSPMTEQQALVPGTRQTHPVSLVWFDQSPEWLPLIQPRLNMDDYGVVASEEETPRLAIIGRLMAMK